MIRKAIIVLLTLACIGACAAWAVSYYGLGAGRTVYTSPNGKPLPARSVHFSSATLYQGHLYVHNGWLPVVPISGEFEQKFRANFTHGLDVEAGEKVRKNIMDATAIVTTVVPLWWLTLLLAAYPAIAFIRGPLRRYRRRRRGLCIRCGYNLEGNVSGVCPECGEAV